MYWGGKKSQELLLYFSYPFFNECVGLRYMDHPSFFNEDDMESHNGDRTYSFLQKEQRTNQVLMLILPLNLGQRCEQGNYCCKSDPSISVLVSKEENNVLICEVAFLLLTSSRGRPLYLKQRLNLCKVIGFG